MNAKLQHVCNEFRIEGTYQSYEEIKVGNVNRTYKVNFSREDGSLKSYIVQAVNTYVFKNPEQVMENIDKVTEHIRGKNPGRIALHFHHTADRKTYVYDENGFWRLFNYIPSTTYDVVDDLDVVHNAGEAFGEFQMQLADFDANMLYYTIPDFHNTIKRTENLKNAMNENIAGRKEEIKKYLIQY